MQLQKIIKALDDKILEKAKDFFASDYFIRQKKYQKVFNHLVENKHLETDELKLKLWKAIYPDKDYKDEAVRKLLFEVQSKLLEFFSIEESIKDDYILTRNLNKFILKNQLNFLKNKQQRQLDKIQFQREVLDSEAYYDLYTAQRHVIWTEDDFARKLRYDNEEEFTNNLNRLNSLLDTAYAIEKIRLLLHQNNFNLLTGKEVDCIDDKNISKLIKEDDLENSLLSKIYQDKFHVLIHGTEELNIKELLEKIRIVCRGNLDEGLELFDNLSNFIADQLNRGQDKFQEQFELFRFGLESKVLLKANNIDPTDFRNIVIVACRVSEFDWALNFVEEYRTYLAPEYRHSAFSFNKARIYMNMKRYGDAVAMLRDVEYDDITYNINSKLMLMHAFYELDEYDVLESTIKAFKIFLRRRRNIAKSRKDNFTDHCDALFNIIKAEEKRDPKRLQKAQAIVDKNAAIPNRSWIKNRIEEVAQTLNIETSYLTEVEPT